MKGINGGKLMLEKANEMTLFSLKNTANAKTMMV